MGNHSKCFKCGELDEFCTCRPAPARAAPEAPTLTPDEFARALALLNQFDQHVFLSPEDKALKGKLAEAAPEAPVLPRALREVHRQQIDPKLGTNGAMAYARFLHAELARLQAAVIADCESAGAAPEAPDSEQQASTADGYRWRDCEDCGGSGRISPSELCRRCEQSGILPAATTASAPRGCENCDGIGACPMCGNAPELIDHGTGSWRVACQQSKGGCGMAGRMSFDKGVTAAAEWNRRAPIAAPIDAEGLPPLPTPAARLYVQNGHRRASVLPGSGDSLYTADQVRQAQRDAKSLGYALGRGAAVREYVEGRSSPGIPDNSQAGGAWVSIDDERKPEARKPILLFVRTLTRGEDDEGRPHEIEGAEIAMGEYRRGMSAEMSYFDCYTSPMSDNDWITHWMPLPAAPSPNSPKEGAKP